jgi:hypothetical protein
VSFFRFRGVDVQGQLGGDFETAFMAVAGLEYTADGLGALAHADQPETTAGRRTGGGCCGGSVVGDRDGQPVGGSRRAGRARPARRSAS